MKGKKNAVKRRKMIEDVFKKGKKQREIAKKFDAKIAMKQGKRNPKIQMHEEKKKIKREEKQKTREVITELDKQFDSIRTKNIIHNK